ncbi:MAG: phosphateNa+ [Prolixibacteraceae bacterium]|nr:MAG: phosphateNa+ [Prolixibacteraceae bacterium]
MLVILVLGGLAIFLHGLNVMTGALKSAAGNRMKFFLKRMTRNRWTSLLAGTGITAATQSSSVTTVLAVGFVSAGLLTFQSTLGLILGANIGSTITAQIIAFKITNAAWIMVALGFLLSVASNKKAFKDSGNIILGLGLVFLGMNLMAGATEPLKTYGPFIDLMKGWKFNLWGILIGLVFTAVVQSSAATTGIVIIMASQGLIGVTEGIAIVLGANIGTCVTAVLSALGKPRAAMRVAISHVLFNVLGVGVWYFFIDDFAHLVELITGADKARQIANAHTIFNLGITLLFIGIVNPVAKLVMFLVPDPKKEGKKLFPELHRFYLKDSSIALDMSKLSIFRLGEHLMLIIERGMHTAMTGNDTDLLRLRNRDDKIDKGYAEVIQFLQQIQAENLTRIQAERLEGQIEAVNIIESTSDIITTDMVDAANHRIKNGFVPSKVAIEKLSALYEIAAQSFHLALKNFHNSDPAISDFPVTKEEFKEKLIQTRLYLSQRLSENDEMRIAIFRFESDLLEAIRRLHAFARRLNRKTG